jgi:hypothetical protein
MSWIVPSYIKVFIVIVLIFGIGIGVWAFHIIPLQLEYNDKCKDLCLNKNMTYETRFLSIPWDALNGECYCKIVERKIIK